MAYTWVPKAKAHPPKGAPFQMGNFPKFGAGVPRGNFFGGFRPPAQFFDGSSMPSMGPPQMRPQHDGRDWRVGSFADPYDSSSESEDETDKFALGIRCTSCHAKSTMPNQKKCHYPECVNGVMAMLPSRELPSWISAKSQIVLCRGFGAYHRCKSDCNHAHSQEELTDWNAALEEKLSQSASLANFHAFQATLQSSYRPELTSPFQLTEGAFAPTTRPKKDDQAKKKKKDTSKTPPKERQQCPPKKASEKKVSLSEGTASAPQEMQDKTLTSWAKIAQTATKTNWADEVTSESGEEAANLKSADHCSSDGNISGDQSDRDENDGPWVEVVKKKKKSKKKKNKKNADEDRPRGGECSGNSPPETVTRPLPRRAHYKNLEKCENGKKCPYGNKCTFAHSDAELAEWERLQIEYGVTPQDYYY